MRFVSRSVITGFVNALAILIFMAQLPELTNVSWHVYAMVVAGLGIIYLFPYRDRSHHRCPPRAGDTQLFPEGKIGIRRLALGDDPRIHSKRS
jgi:hypothetical protein